MQTTTNRDARYETGSLVPAPADVREEVRDFLYREAELIDDRRFGEWLKLVAEDFSYRMPVPVTPDNPLAPHYDSEAFIINENRATLSEHWFRRYEPDMWEMAWAENPPVRYRHFITNVRVRESGEDGVYDVRSNVILTGTRQSDRPTVLYVERFDKLSRGENDFVLHERFAVPESTLIEFSQLRVVL